MAYGNRKILMYGVIGIMAAIIVSSSVLVLPNLITNVYAKTGTLVVKVTDAPVPDLKNLNLTISGVEVLNSSGIWVPLSIEGGEAYFDLLKLENVTKDLSIGSLLNGNYTKIRMMILSANATLGDNRTITLRVPPGHIDIQVKFEIKPGKTTELIIDIIADKIQIANAGKSGKPANLNPQFKAIVIPPP